MPKRVGYLYNAMLDYDLIRAAIWDGSKNKRKRWDVAPVLEDIETHVRLIYDMLANDKYVPAKPRSKRIYDSCGSKYRTIQIVPFFPDGVINQLVIKVMEPVLLRGMYHWSCASIPGRGGSHATKQIKRILKNDPKGTKYVLKFDIRKFYPTIDRKLLIWALARKVKDKKFLKLVYDMLCTCPKGLAIGYYMCQWLANFYLESLDNFIMTLPGVKYMVRYMDDIVILGTNKKQLHKAHIKIEEFLKERLRLSIKSNWQVFPIRARMLDFVGYKFDHMHTTLRRRNFLRLTRQSRRIQKLQKSGSYVSFRMASGFLSRSGQLKHCDSHLARVKYIDPIKIKQLKEVVRHESKRRQSTISSILVRTAA